MPPAELDDLAFQLFKLFAQYEYALKAMGYVKSGHGGRAEPDWDRFTGAIGRRVLELDDPQVMSARNLLLDAPPKKQILVDGRIEWCVVSNHDRSAQALFGHIRRVRNNLYHGGKFNGRWFEPDRSRPLMESSLVLLKALRGCDVELSQAIAGNEV